MSKSVSIIIPAYNSEKTIEKCLKSLINQTYKNLEIIVVNDGSKDKTAEIVSSYTADSRVKLINKENGGVSAARNTGIDVAQGEYITFIDSDDYVDVGYIEKLSSVCGQDVDVAFCNYVKEDEKGIPIIDGRKLLCEDFKVSATDIAEKYFYYSDMGIVNFAPRFIKRKTIGDTRYSTTLKWGEDCSFNLEIFKKMANMYCICETGYHYVIHSGQTTAKRMKNYGDMMIIHIGHIDEFITKYGGYEKNDNCAGMGRTWVAVILEAVSHCESLKEYKNTYKKMVKQPWMKYIDQTKNLSFRLKLVKLFIKLKRPELIYFIVFLYKNFLNRR